MSNDLWHPEWLKSAPSAVRLFALFSRFEFALKRAGYTIKGQQDAQPCWDTLAGRLGEPFFKAVLALPEASTLIQHPPRKQIVREDGSLGWKPEPPAFPTQPDSIHRLFVCVRTVRNNLFHGGKIPFDTDRDEALINSALAILEFTLRHAPADLVGAFNNPS